MICSYCGAEKLQEDFAFCPQCGMKFNKSFSCATCGRDIEPDSKFCPKCGTAQHVNQSTKGSTKHKKIKKAEVVDIEPPPPRGLTIEFPVSASLNFSFALKEASQFSSFIQYGDGRKALYRVTFMPNEIDLAINLVEYLKGWRSRVVYVDGEKVPWESVFNFIWCYNRRISSFKPDFYCFGYGQYGYQVNIWGCIQAELPFMNDSHWFMWGRWSSEEGDWEFDKERIRHELQNKLYPYRFCPFMQIGLAEEMLEALPSKVNPKNDKNWKFVEHWDEPPTGSPYIMVTETKHGYNEKRYRIGVTPNGTGALQKILKKGKRNYLPLSNER